VCVTAMINDKKNSHLSPALHPKAYFALLVAVIKMPISLSMETSTIATCVFRIFSNSEYLSKRLVLCSWAKHSTLTVPLSTQVYKWVSANLMLGVTQRWTSIPSRGE